MTGSAGGSGLAQSLRRLADSAVAVAQTRLALLGTELEQEKQRLYDAVALLALGLLLIGVALVLSVGFVVMLFQEGYRLAALGVLTLAFGAAGLWLLRQARTRLQAGEGGPFALSLAELRHDRRGLGEGEPPADPR